MEEKATSSIDQLDMGVAIQNLIEAYLSAFLNTSYLAKVDKYNQDSKTVDIIPLDTPDQVLLEVPILIPSTNALSFKPKIEKDQLGFAIVTKTDISAFSKDNVKYPIQTAREFNKEDSIFIPCSFAYELDTKGDNVIESQENLKVEAKAFAFKTKNDSLKDLIESFIDIMTQAKTINATPGSPLTFDPDVIAKLVELKTKIGVFFNE